MSNILILTPIIPLCDRVYAFKGMILPSRSAPFGL